jgi:hypothetical protein
MVWGICTHGAKPEGKVIMPSSSKGPSVGHSAGKLDHPWEPSGDGTRAQDALLVPGGGSPTFETQAPIWVDLIPKVIKVMHASRVPETRTLLQEPS